jgi:Cd2+/Zn2+-exporting ATPase
MLLTENLNAITLLLARYHAVGMGGDGINDAPVLAKATISFAMNKGADTVLETADMTLMNDNLAMVPTFIDLSYKTAMILRQKTSTHL